MATAERRKGEMEMVRLTIVLVLCSMLVATPWAQEVSKEPKAVEAWFNKAGKAKGKEKVTKLHFYFHDIVSGPKPTAIEVARSSITDKSPTLFGLVSMIDDPLTEGPQPDSKIIGRAQGFYGSAGLEELGLLMTMNFVFTEKWNNGSTISILGRNPAMQEYREMPIVGGTGVFRLARGIATAKTVKFNMTSGDAIVEYNVILKHY